MLDLVLHSLILTEINRSLLYFTRAAFEHLFSEEPSSTIIPKRVFLSNDAVNIAKTSSNEILHCLLKFMGGVLFFFFFVRLFLSIFTVYRHK